MPELKGQVLVTGQSIAEPFLARLATAGLDVVNPPESFPPRALSEDDLADELRRSTAYLLGGMEVATSTALAEAKNLKVISFLGVGYQSFVDVQAAAKLQIPVTSTRGASSNSVAEFTVGLLLEARRRIIYYASAEWGTQAMVHTKRRDLAAHPVGVVGLGAIGTRICEIMRRGFDADVWYYSRTRKWCEEERLGLRYSPLCELVSRVESLVVMVPETPDTISMINRDVLSHSNLDVPLTLINTARAEIVDADALLWALNEGRVESVWFDGFYRQASAASRALEARPEVRITPHIASMTHDARDAMAATAVSSLLNVLRTGSDSYIVA